MEVPKVQKAPLPWWVAGLFLGFVQVLAFALVKPLGVSTQFVVIDSMVIHQTNPEYAQNHDLLSQEKYQKFGYGTYLDIGLIIGAAVSAIAIKRWRLTSIPVWWQVNHGRSVAKRFIMSFIGGFLILLGARLGHGCTSGQFASGWAQLSLSAIPFTITLFGFGMLTALFVYKKTPQIEK